MRKIVSLIYVINFVARFFVGLALGFYLGYMFGSTNIAQAIEIDLYCVDATCTGGVEIPLSQDFYIEFIDDGDTTGCSSPDEWEIELEDALATKYSFFGAYSGAGTYQTPTFNNQFLIDQGFINVPGEYYRNNVVHLLASSTRCADGMSAGSTLLWQVGEDPETPSTTPSSTEPLAISHEYVLSQSIFNWFFLALFTFFCLIFYFKRQSQS